MNRMLLLSFACTSLLGILPGCQDTKKTSKPRPQTAQNEPQNAQEVSDEQEVPNQFGIKLEPGEKIISVKEHETKQVFVPEENAKF